MTVVILGHEENDNQYDHEVTMMTIMTMLTMMTMLAMMTMKIIKTLKII